MSQRARIALFDLDHTLLPIDSDFTWTSFTNAMGWTHPQEVQRQNEAFYADYREGRLDMHAYIIQCNDRQYGDSRIRAPAKDSWARDVLRVKGGVTDYCVIGEIDVQALRQFQSSHRSPAKPFKPAPDGFEIDFGRKVLAAGVKE